ncbi:MAG: glycosyltransferase family 2 protein [Gemmataceae bacterium]
MRLVSVELHADKRIPTLKFMNTSTPTLSVVIPLLNEEEVLPQTYAELKRHLDALNESYELVFVDDGSTDRSRSILTDFSRRDPSVRIIALSRNFGHEMATTAGLHHARGRAVVVMDADLQDPPELIATFLAKWREGYEVVYGVRLRRERETLLKKATSFFFYRLMAQIADIKFPPDTGDFRLMDRRVLDVYRVLNEDPRFFRGLVGWIGFRQIGVGFVRRPRIGGVTKYRYSKLIKLAMDNITAFSTLPSLAITMLASFCLVCSLGVAAVMVLGWLMSCWTIPAWGWVSLAFLGLFNLQFCCMAMLGEYIVRTHRYAQQRPLYVMDVLIENGEAIPAPPPNISTRR